MQHLNKIRASEATLAELERGSESPSSLTDEWLTTSQAADDLGVSAGSLRNMTSNGQVPYNKLGKRNRYRLCLSCGSFSSPESEGCHMGYKYNPEKKHWEAWHGKRHLVTGVPHTLKRVGFKTENAARKAEKVLIAEVERRLHEKVVPKWKALVDECRKANLEKGMTEKTVENYHVCLKAHTFEAWGDRTADSITTEDIRALIKARVGDKAPSH